jgi:NitT/TauT family transport system substrate-binding protein
MTRLRRPCARRPALAAAVLAGALALAACAGGPPTVPTPSETGPGAVIGLTYIPNVQFAPFYVAEADRALPDGVTLRHHGSAEGLFTALAAGQEQFVVAGGDEILQARGQGTDIIAVAAYYRRYPVRLIVPTDSPIQSAADLGGRTIGLPGPYGENWFALVLALQQAGLAEADVAVQSIGYTQQAALASGQVDAVVGFANGDAVAFEAAGFPVRLIDPEVPLVSICLATTEAFAAARPEVVRGAVAGLQNGLAAVVADPAHARDVAGHSIPDFTAEARAGAEPVLTATVSLLTDAAGQLPSRLDPAEWTAMAAAMRGAGLVGDVDGPAAMTNDYV